MPRATRSTGAWWTITALTAASVLLLGACSSGSSTTAKNSGDSTTPTVTISPSDGGSSSSGGTSASSSKPTGKPLEKFRIGNFYTAKGGGPGPSLDVYEYQNVSGNAPIVLLKDVAYGTISKYVDPPSYSDSTGERSFQLGVVTTGAKVKTSQDLTGLGGAGSLQGEYYQQDTLLLTASVDDQSQPGDDALPGMQSGPFVEKPGPKQQGSDQVTLPKKSSGGQLILRDATDPSDHINMEYLKVDGECVKAVEDTSTSDAVPTLFTTYDVAPGSHDVVIGTGAEEDGETLKSCDAVTKLGEGTVDASAGSQVLVVYYSSDRSKTLNLASATIDD